jgi:hypothetical protein
MGKFGRELTGHQGVGCGHAAVHPVCASSASVPFLPLAHLRLRRCGSRFPIRGGSELPKPFALWSLRQSCGSPIKEANRLFLRNPRWDALGAAAGGDHERSLPLPTRMADSAPFQTFTAEEMLR